MGYQGWALLSALFAGLTALLVKLGVQGVPSNLALAIRVVVILAFSAAIAIATKETKLSAITPKGWMFLALSGVATGASWLCYFRALQGGDVSRVAPIDKLSFVIAMALGFLFLKEKVTPNLVGGAALIIGGVLLTLR